jgi:hypothetical protein
MTKPKLTPKQAKFVKGIAEGKTQREAYTEAYDTNGTKEVVDVQASQLMSKDNIQEALQQLFGYEETKQIVQNVHKLAISADDQKVQLEASKEWLNRVLPKTGSSSPTTNIFGNVQVTQKDKYDL